MNRRYRQKSGSQNQQAIQNQEINPFTKININQLTPIQFLIKYEPPQLSMYYKRHPKDSKKHAYNISLSEQIYQMDSYDITRQLFVEHPDYLKTKYFEQIQSLVQKILDFKLNEGNLNNDEVDEEQVQIKYNQMIDEGHSHQQVVEYFRQFGIEIEPLDEDNEEQQIEQDFQQNQQYQNNQYENQIQKNQSNYQQNSGRSGKLNDLRDLSKNRKH